MGSRLPALQHNAEVHQGVVPFARVGAIERGLHQGAYFAIPHYLPIDKKTMVKTARILVSMRVRDGEKAKAAMLQRCTRRSRQGVQFLRGESGFVPLNRFDHVPGRFLQGDGSAVLT
jgi:hypothetical protein